MDPVKLPLELFVQIMQQLPLRYIWLLRSVSKAWQHALNSPALTAGQDVNSVRSVYTSKPTGYQDLTTAWFPVRLCALNEHRLAWMTRKADSVVGTRTGNAIFVRDLDAGTTTKYPVRAPSGADSPTALVLCDFVACVFGQKLLTFPSGRRRQLPGKYNLGAVNSHKQTVAIMQSQDERPTSVIEANTLWLYNHDTDQWTSVQTPGNGLVGCWWQGVVIDQGLHVINISMHPWVSSNRERDYVVHIWSPIKELTVMYKASCYTNGLNAGSFTPRWAGSRYHIRVGTEQGCHDLLMTLDGHVSVYTEPVAAWYDAIYSPAYGGIETSRGFLWADWDLVSPYRPSEFRINERYVITIEEQSTEIRVFAFNLEKGGRPLDRIVWQDGGNDKVAVAKAHLQALSQRVIEFRRRA